MFCASTEYLNFVKNLKEKGYKTKLIFSFNGESNLNHYIGYNSLDKIFDLNTFNLFDDIVVLERPITSLTYDGLKYHHSQYGATKPGQHWWDVYFDEIPNNITYPNYDPRSFLYKNIKPNIFPKFNSEVYDRAQNFLKRINKEHNFLQVRYLDYNNNIETDFLKKVDILYDKIKKSKSSYHVGGNNKIVNEKFSKLPNVIKYDFKNLSLFSNDHSYYHHNRNIPNDVLLDRLYDNLAEMVSVSYTNKIFLFTKFSWISNFLYYGLCMNKNKVDFNLINDNINSIEL